MNISDSPVDFLNLSRIIGVESDDDRRRIEFSRMTDRLALAQVYNADRTRILQTVVFTIPHMGKEEFANIDWQSLLNLTSGILAGTWQVQFGSTPDDNVVDLDAHREA